MLRLSDVTVFPHIANEPSRKLQKAQNTKDNDIHSVFPERTAPSHISASRYPSRL